MEAALLVVETLGISEEEVSLSLTVAEGLLSDFLARYAPNGAVTATICCGTWKHALRDREPMHQIILPSHTFWCSISNAATFESDCSFAYNRAMECENPDVSIPVAIPGTRPAHTNRSRSLTIFNSAICFLY